MYVVTPRDPTCQSWTHDRPSAPMLHRVAVLAQRSAEGLERLLVEGVLGPDGEGAAATHGRKRKRQAQRAKPQRRITTTAVLEAVGQAAMARLFGRDEREYDVLLRLRHKALPYAHRGSLLPGEGGAAAGGDAAGGTAAAAQGQGGQEAPAPQLVLSAGSTKLCRSILTGIPHSELLL